MHKGEVPSLVSPTNDAALPSRECLQKYPKPSWDRGMKYEGGNPMRHNIWRMTKTKRCTHLTHTQAWIWVLTLLMLMYTATAQPRSEPQCFMAVHNRRGLWNARVHRHLTIEAKSPHTETTSMLHTAHRRTHCSEAAAYTN